MTAELLVRATELAWRHWTALGVAGVAPMPEHAIDLEALIAFTPFVLATEPRLERECVDWCSRLGPHHVSVSRLRQVNKLMPARGEAQGADLVRLLIERPRGVAARARLSGKSREPRVEHPALVQIRSRHLFGIGARADVAVALVTRMHGRDAVRGADLVAAGYTRRAISLVFEDLVAAGVLEKLVVGKATSYKLVRGKELRGLLAPLPARTRSWPQRLALVAAVLATTRRHEKHARSTQAIELVKVLDRMRTCAASVGEAAPITGRPEVVVERVPAWAMTLLDG